MTQSPSTPAYRLGPGDRVRVRVVPGDEASGEYEVGPDGALSLPLAGTIQVGGKTRSEVARSLEQKLNPFYERPRRVDLDVLHYENNKVYVLGRVEQPGIVELRGQGDLLQAIAEAGGLPVREFRSYLARCAVIRGRDEIIWVDLVDLLQHGNLALNVPLRNGDVVYIPDSEDTVVFVMGEVASPGAVPIKVRLSLTQALAQAGGPTEDADLEEVYLIRENREGGEAQAVRIDLKDLLENADFARNFELSSGDIIYVSRTGFGDVNYALRKIAPGLAIVGTAAVFAP